MAQHSSRIRISMGDRTVEVEGSEEFVLRQFERLGGFVIQAASRPAAASAVPAASTASASVLNVEPAPAVAEPIEPPAMDEASVKETAMPPGLPGPEEIAPIMAPPEAIGTPAASEEERLLTAARSSTNFSHLILFYARKEKCAGQADITVAAFKDFCAELGKKVPSWVDTLFIDHINRTGYLIQGSKRGSWQISANGETFVAENLPALVK